MRIIAESGATKTDWRSVAEDGTVRSARTVGLNPAVCDAETIMSAVREAIPALDPDGKRVEAIYFYGASHIFLWQYLSEAACISSCSCPL